MPSYLSDRYSSQVTELHFFPDAVYLTALLYNPQVGFIFHTHFQLSLILNRVSRPGVPSTGDPQLLYIHTTYALVPNR